MPLRMADEACEQLAAARRHPPVPEALAAREARRGHRRHRGLPEAVRRAVPRERGVAGDPRGGAGHPESREGDPRVRPARPSGDGRRRRRGPGHLLARRRGGRGPPRPAAVVPDRRPVDEAGGLPRRFPLHEHRSTARARIVPNIEALQTGRVWQAEEVREGDRWRRYYGFVGRHALTRVARRGDRVPRPLAAGLVAALDRPGRPDRHQGGRDRPARSRSSSRSGTTAGSRRRPRPTSSGTPTARLTIREGIAFRLVRESDKPEAPDPFAGLEGAREKPFPPEEIAARPFRRHPDGASSRTLAPAGDGRRVSTRPSHPLPHRSARPLPPGDHLRRPEDQRRKARKGRNRFPRRRTEDRVSRARDHCCAPITPRSSGGCRRRVLAGWEMMSACFRRPDSPLTPAWRPASPGLPWGRP